MARRPCQHARVVQLDECLITNQEVWEFESPRALHNLSGMGKLGSIRQIAGSKPASLTNSGKPFTRRASRFERDPCRVRKLPPHQYDDVAECRGSRLQPAQCRLDSCRRLHAPVARTDRPPPSKRTLRGFESCPERHYQSTRGRLHSNVVAKVLSDCRHTIDFDIEWARP
jgi:hypothetical protein